MHRSIRRILWRRAAFKDEFAYGILKQGEIKIHVVVSGNDDCHGRRTEMRRQLGGKTGKEVARR
jgi:hypothetical protein